MLNYMRNQWWKYQPKLIFQVVENLKFSKFATNLFLCANSITLVQLSRAIFLKKITVYESSSNHELQVTANNLRNTYVLHKIQHDVCTANQRLNYWSKVQRIFGGSLNFSPGQQIMFISIEFVCFLNHTRRFGLYEKLYFWYANLLSYMLNCLSGIVSRFVFGLFLNNDDGVSVHLHNRSMRGQWTIWTVQG